MGRLERAIIVGLGLLVIIGWTYLLMQVFNAVVNASGGELVAWAIIFIVCLFISIPIYFFSFIVAIIGAASD